MNSDFINELVVKKAAEESARLQKIQMIVWDYMQMQMHLRDGILMAIEISKLFKKDENSDTKL